MEKKRSSSEKDLMLSIIRINDELNKLNDVDSILDKILYEARMLTNAEAGSIFLVNEGRLEFSYVHNDFLFKENEENEALYSDFIVEINKESIVGYSALKEKVIFIDDAYNIPKDSPYNFNTSYDILSGYETKSILTIPLFGGNHKLVGVMQLINALDENKNKIPFDRDRLIYIQLLSNSASLAIERGIMNNEIILRMMRMAELHDPKETGAHVQRVGAYSATIYQKWAVKNNIPKKEMKHMRGLIRLAAMLHDVGKVGVPDAIIKKPGKLTQEEFSLMKWHTVNGAKLFMGSTSELDILSSKIAINHHEKWDGTGYPGYIEDLNSEKIEMGKPKRGKEIPLAARITTLADVFDALVSKRSYKEAWDDEKVIGILKKDSGTHFDPELVEIFLEIFPIIKAIRKKLNRKLKGL